MHRMIAGLMALACSALLTAEDINHPRNELLYDQSGRESAMRLKCERNLSNDTLTCDLATQYLSFMDDSEFYAEHEELNEQVERMFDEEDDILGTAATLCESMSSTDMETELIERYESKDFRDIGRRYIEQFNALCSADTVEDVKAAYLEMTYIDLDQRAITCTVGLSLSELEFTLSDSGNAWVYDSEITIGACELRTTAILTPYDEWKWEYRQTRIPLSGSCDNDSNVLSYKTDSVKTFEAQCSAVDFSKWPGLTSY